MTHRIVVFFALLTTAACGGRDGLQESEFGAIFFWKVESAELVWRDCTDADSFRTSIEAPMFEDNSYVVYRVLDDGSALVDQDCTAIDASTCADSDLDLVFEKSGEEFIHDPPLVAGAEMAPGCRLTSDPMWTIDDQGQQMFLDVSLEFGLQGDAACDGVDANIAASGTNEFGIDGCVATIEVVTDFAARRMR